MFVPHPSKELTDLFIEKPYQGAPPDQALFLFIGLDANYDARLAEKPIFKKILEYHVDGVKFWMQNGVHHPFLLAEYTGDGRFYHRSFSRIGFAPGHANLVSFTELLNIPTVGRSRLAVDDLDLGHLEKLNNSILSGAAKHVFLSGEVARLMRSSRMFPWLPKIALEGPDTLGVWYQTGVKTVYSHLHFSVYGKFADRKTREAIAIRELLVKNS